MDNKPRRAPRSDDDLENAEGGRMTEGHKSHYTWSRGEKQLLLVAIIVLLYHFNVFNFFHGQNVEEEDESFQYLTGISGSIMANELLDTVGQNWVPIKDRDTLRCTNLDSLIKRRGNIRDDEKLLWEDLGCEGKLADLYLKWEQSNSQLKQHCDKWKEDYQIDVGIDWGFAPDQVMAKWKQFRCDCHYPAGWKDNCLHGLPPTVHESTTPAGIDAAANARPSSERLSSPDPSQGLPVIAIVLGTTSRGYRWEELNDSPLIRIFLSSVARSLEPGFEYRIYAGFDVGDLFYDNDAKLAELQDWFKRKVQTEAQKQGVLIQLAFPRFLNILRKPGPIFNFLTASAYMDGADYMYRINDDTEFRTPWASAMTDALSKFSPPNLGVVGPICYDGNQKILTHDFVHRTHRSIFQTYYPVVFSDWWMDDWISKVYPADNTLRHPAVAVSHHTWMTGGGDPVRYQVDHTHETFLEDELRRGLKVIGTFQEKHCRHGACDAPDGHTTPQWKGTYDESKQTVFESLFDVPAVDFENVWQEADMNTSSSNKEEVDWYADELDGLYSDYEYPYNDWQYGQDVGDDGGSDWEMEVNVTEDKPWAEEKADDEWVSVRPLGRGPGNSQMKAAESEQPGRKRGSSKPKIKGFPTSGAGGQGWSHEETEDKVTDALRHQIKKLEDLAKNKAHNVFVPRGRQSDSEQSEDDDLLEKINKMEADILKLKEEYSQRVEHREKERQADVAKVLDSAQVKRPLTSSQIERASVVMREDEEEEPVASAQAVAKPKHPVLSDKAAKLVKSYAKNRKKQRKKDRAEHSHKTHPESSHEELREMALLDMMRKEAGGNKGEGILSPINEMNQEPAGGAGGGEVVMNWYMDEGNAQGAIGGGW